MAPRYLNLSELMRHRRPRRAARVRAYVPRIPAPRPPVDLAPVDLLLRVLAGLHRMEVA